MAVQVTLNSSDFNDPGDKSVDKSSQIDKFYHVNGKWKSEKDIGQHSEMLQYWSCNFVFRGEWII